MSITTTGPVLSDSPRAAGAPAIVVEDLVKTYPGDVRALAGISFEVAAGSVFALLGPNGAGKSTTVKILTTLTRADSGRALVAGHDVTRAPDAVRRAIGSVGQRTAVDPTATARENLVLAGRLFGLRGAALRRRVDELLERFRLIDVADRLTRTYSGGMSRRLDVAIGLVARPDVLFLDEPTTGLDPEARGALWAELQALTHEETLTILLTTHYLDEADRLADRIAIVDRGAVVAAGTSDELKAELHGDTLVLDLLAAPDPARVRSLLTDAVHGLDDVVVDERRVRARVAMGAASVPLALAALEAHGLGVAAATVARPSLDDVYLRHTGRSLTGEQSGSPEVAR